MGFTFQVPTVVGGTVLVIERIESQNYVPGASGWDIEADGSAEFNNVTVRGKLITGADGTQHIEINGSDAPQGVAFFTGDAAETFPGVIQPQADSSELTVTHSSPLVTGHAGASLVLATGKTGADPDRLDAGAQSVSISGTDDVTLSGGGTTVVFDASGLQSTGPVHDTDLSDPSNTFPAYMGPDSGWVDLTPSSGWAHSPYSGVPTAQCRKIGNRVYFRGSLSGTSLAVNTTTPIATVPAGYFNGKLRNFKPLETTGGFVGWGNVTDTGVLQAHFKTPWTTAAAIIDVTGMSYLMD